MNIKDNKFKILMSLIIVGFFLSTPVISATNTNSFESVTNKGFTKGVSYLPVKPVEKITLIDFDEDTYVDDYAYLASVPGSVFRDDDHIISSPLLFYDEPYEIEEYTDRSMNARQGLDFFMEDWMEYCNGEMDKATLINVEEKELDYFWDSKEYTEIISDDIYDISNKIALDDWSYSDNAVLAVVDSDYESKEKNEINGNIEGTVPSKEIKTESFQLPQANKITPIFREFEVPEGYKFMKARVWWPCFYFGFDSSGFFMTLNISVPPGDPNLELFCKYKDKWMQVAATLGWNPKHGMDVDYTSTYIYHPGDWKVSVTDVPTHSFEGSELEKMAVHRNIGPLKIGRYGSLSEALKNLNNVNYNVDIDMYPGVEIDIKDVPMYGCTDAYFNLTWDDPNANLGLSLIGPAGEEILSVANGSRTDGQELYVEGLGECLEDENYKICVFSMQDISHPIDFQLDYSWKQGISDKLGNSLSSASEGAVLASTKNSPLIYTQSNEFNKETKETLLKLGVKNIDIIDLGSRLESDVKNEINYNFKINSHYKNLKNIYDTIMKTTGQNDVIFTTLDPWSYWVVDTPKPKGEYKAGLHLGPATYIAAHHGSPVLIIENHPQLSSSTRYHTEFWKKMASDPVKPEGLPSVAEMYITGTRVYEFLDEYGFDKEGMESMITVAGQYDIGVSWDRTFFGKATPGRFLGSPVDTAYWISRTVFYPALVFVNPATNPNGVTMINGSTSERRFPQWTSLGLKILKESGEEKFTYPVLHSYLTYNHRFNERASKYWGWKYKCADGNIPGESVSFDAIDKGVNMKYYGDPGAYFPDFTDSEIIPLYSERAGYDNVFSTEKSAIIENLNRGVLIWMGTAHGGGGTDGGIIKTWNKDSPLVHEENPWRGYEWYLGSTEEPDTMSIENYGIIPMIFGNPTQKGLTGHGFFRTSYDYGLAKKPVLDFISKISNLPLLRIFAPDWLKDSQDYYDGVVASTLFGLINQGQLTALEMDDEVDNLHSAGFINGCCLLATKYFHITLIRHGTVFQVFDPWPTSWYTSWQSDIPRNIAMGDTVGEAFIEGISHVGIMYLTDQWWADIKQNVCYYGDPDLRPLVPSTEYSEGVSNYWEIDETKPLRSSEDISFNGHMPLGVDNYPNQRNEKSILENYFFVIILVILIILVAIVLLIRGKKRK